MKRHPRPPAAVVRLPEVRATLARLDALAVERPELVGGPAGAHAAKAWERELAPMLGAEVASMAARKKGEVMKVQAFRLPESLIERLDWYAENLARLTGLDVSRTDALRHALGKALAQAEIDFKAADAARAQEAKGRRK